MLGTVTLFVVHLHAKSYQWLEGFQSLYKSFWDDDEIARTRKFLVNDVTYITLRDVLKKRLASTNNNLTPEENDELEKIDRFCALMVRISFFANLSRNKEHRNLYRATFSFWIDKLKQRD
ncbi:MAG: hypothetical protein NVV83_09610 [Afipia sp.]|nr:hypothetical protein [Afipia sp.]